MNRKAVSLVEIMIGVVLLALVILPSLNVISSQGKSVTATRDHTAAAYIAQKVQEMCRSFQFTLIEADQYSSNAEKQKTTFEWLIQNDEEYSKHTVNGIDYKITDAAVTPILFDGDKEDASPLVYAFTFSILYTGKDKKEHTLSICTAVSKRE